MIVWRIANKRFAGLEGSGGLLYSGRWHSKGRPIVYLAESSALAILEVRVHMGLDSRFLGQYVLMKIHIPEDVAVAPIDKLPANENESQKLGNRWLQEAATALCRVQSILAPECNNYLLNPLHPEAGKVQVIDKAPFDFDSRLFK